ncbi:hypothetical protein Hdeb2414_s0003g00085211 [Helianthus debilis subsp. tardiflorus]
MKCRIELEKARLLIFEVADQLDRFGNKKAHGALAMAKVLFGSYGLKFLLLILRSSLQCGTLNTKHAR